MEYPFNHIFFSLIFFFCYIFVFFFRIFHCDPSCDSACIISCGNILLWHVHISCSSTYITSFLFPLCNLYSCARIYQSCIMFRWFDVCITPSLVLFLCFYWIVHSLYFTWLIACHGLCWPLTHKFHHLVCLWGFQKCSNILQVGWTVCWSSFPYDQ